MKKNFKRDIVVISVVVAGLLGFLAYFNSNLNAYLSLSYLYFKNRKPLIFGSMTVPAPFYYLRSLQNNDLVLTKFPVNGTHIYVNSNYSMSMEKFKITYNRFLYKSHFIINSEGELKIDKQDAYSISSISVSSPLPVEEDIYIPAKKTLIKFSGKEEDLPAFKELIKGIRFASP